MLFFSDDLNILIALGAGVADDGNQIIYRLGRADSNIDCTSHRYILIGDYFNSESKRVAYDLLIGVLESDS